MSYIKFSQGTQEYTISGIATTAENELLIIFLLSEDDEVDKSQILALCKNPQSVHSIEAHVESNSCIRDEAYEGYTKFKRVVDDGSERYQVYLGKPDVSDEISELKAMIATLLTNQGVTTNE